VTSRLATHPLTFTVTLAYIITRLTQSQTLEKHCDTYTQQHSSSMLPSSPDKDLSTTPTNDSMDRLSAPANETQKTDRKFKGIRNLFKHSHSSSASSSSAILTKQPPLDGSSPLLSPYVRSGFKQVGLLPSERSYSSLFHRGKQEEHGRQPLVSTTENEEEHSSKSMTSLQNKDCGPAHVEDENVQNSKLRLQSLNDVLSKYPTEKEAHKGAVAEVDVTDIDQAISSDADKHSSLPFGSSHRIMEAMHGKHYYKNMPDATTYTVIEKSHSSRSNIGLSGVQNLNLDSFYKSNLWEGTPMITDNQQTLPNLTLGPKSSVIVSVPMTTRPGASTRPSNF
jgi:hypothetical protein